MQVQSLCFPNTAWDRSNLHFAGLSLDMKVNAKLLCSCNAYTMDNILLKSVMIFGRFMFDVNCRDMDLVFVYLTFSVETVYKPGRTE